MVHVIDDTEAIRLVMADLLAHFGYRVETFPSAVAYLDFVDTPAFEEPLAVFTDVRMPGTNGYEMMARVLERYPRLRFVVISGEPTITHDAKEFGCLYLSKPFTPDRVEEILGILKDCQAQQGYRSQEFFSRRCLRSGDRGIFSRRSTCPKCECGEAEGR